MTPALAVAVVIPVRDGREYVVEAVHSARDQVPAPAEIVVVDDGSTDDSGERGRAAGARVIRQLPGGAGSARNTGVRSCHSPLVAFLDVDDRMAPGRLALQVAALSENGDLDGVLGLIRTFRDHPPWTGGRTADDGRTGGERGPVEPGWLPSTLLVRRAAFLDSGGFDEDLCAGEFVDWMARCRSQGRRFVMLDVVVAERRAHDDNTTRDAARLRRGYLEVARRAIVRHRVDDPRG